MKSLIDPITVAPSNNDIVVEFKASSKHRSSEILVSGSFLEAFPMVVAKLNETHRIQCFDCHIPNSISVILDAQQAIMVVSEDSLSTKEMLRSKIHEIIAASIQYSRLCIVVLSDSSSPISKELLLQLSQSVARLHCQLCIRSCSFDDEGLVRIISSLFYELLHKAHLTFIKPDIYSSRQYLRLFNNLPIFNAQAYALQKLPYVNIFLAAVILTELPFNEIFLNNPTQLVDCVRKYSLFSGEIEEKLTGFLKAVNQLL